MSAEVEEIDIGSCFDLLRRCTVGRVAINVERLGPHVVPVNYTVDGEVIVFRTDAGTTLRLLDAGPVSFQIDSIDHASRTGWSVLVHGVAYEADDWEVRRLELQPWASGPKSHWVRLVPGSVTGRRIAPDHLPFDERGYR